MRSIGIDNIGLAINLGPSLWRDLRRSCHFKNTETGAYAFLPELIYFIPKVSFILMNINIPKLAFGHNVTLAQPNDIGIALTKCESLLPIPISLLNAEVRSVHFTYTQDTPFPYQLWKEHITVPKHGKWRLQEEENGIYYNNANSKERVFFYSKNEHLRAKGRVLPQMVINQCDHEHIIRLELRLDRAVRKQLRVRGLWTNHFLLCSDLLTPEGFLAFVKLFEWRASQCVMGPKEKKPYLPSFMERAILSKPKESAKFYRPKLSEGDYFGMLNEIAAFEKKERPKELLLGIQAECNRAYERYNLGTAITGKIGSEELSYARS